MKYFSLRNSLRPATAVALLFALGLGACSRSGQVIAPAADSAKKLGGLGRDIPVECPTWSANTADSALDYVVLSGMVPSYTSRRIRFEMFGDIASPTVQNMGPCVATETPAIRFTSGHANVFLNGTTQSITFTGQQLTFGELLYPGALLEKGVVVANDAEGNVLEVIWPDLAGTGIGAPIVRVQLARWNLNLVTTSQTYDVVWDMVAEQAGVPLFFKGHAERLNLSGSAVPQAGSGSLSPCPQTLAATSDTVITQLAGIVQFRTGRLRAEIIGDVPTGTIEASGACAAADPGTIIYTGGAANVFRAGTNTSVTVTGGEFTFNQLLFPGLVLEPGVVVASDSRKNVLEIVWPAMVGLPPGPPILRLQLTNWNSWVIPGKRVDVTMRFNAIGNDGISASYLALGKNILVPAFN